MRHVKAPMLRPEQKRIGKSIRQRRGRQEVPFSTAATTQRRGHTAIKGASFGEESWRTERRSNKCCIRKIRERETSVASAC